MLASEDLRLVTLLGLQVEEQFSEDAAQAPDIHRLIVYFFADDDFGWAVTAGCHVRREGAGLLFAELPATE